MIKIRDVIEVPKVQKVVRPEELRKLVGQKSELEPLAIDYVITDDIERNFHEILDYMVANAQYQRFPSAADGKGFFVSGLCGSGKSHFLSILVLLFREKWTWDYLRDKSQAISKAEDILKNRNPLVVEMTALDCSDDERLEDFVFRNIEEVSGYPLTPSSIYLEKFQEHIATNPMYKDDFNKFIYSQFQEKLDWNTLLKNTKDAQQYAKKFVDKQKIPFKLESTRQERFNKLMEIVGEGKEYSDVILLIDELSEYLNSKEGNQLHRDGTFLQFLGQKSASADIPVWTICAMLEGVEEVLSAFPEQINLIKGRFNTNLNLSIVHVKEIISQRLIKTKNSEKVEEAIDIIFERFKNLKNRISKDEFKKIYPVHPDTLELLKHSTNYLSKERSVVDFINEQINGNVSAGIEGILDKEYTTLLTPDKIFDHFEKEIKEHYSLKDYYNKAYLYYDRNLPSIISNNPEVFQNPHADLDFAKKLIKILILLKINSIEKNVSQLQDMLMYTTELEGEFAYRYISDVLETLRRDGAYIGLKERSADLDKTKNIYYIDLGITYVDWINTETKNKIKSLKHKDSKLERPILNHLNTDPIPLKVRLSDYKELAIQWNFQNRYGASKVMNLQELKKSDLVKSLKDIIETEIDYNLFIGSFLNTEEQQKHIEQILKEAVTDYSNTSHHSLNTLNRLASGIIYWIPSEQIVLENIEPLQKFYAHKKIEEEYREDSSEKSKEILEYIQELIQQDLSKIQNIMKSAYLNGTVYNINGAIKIDLNNYKNSSFKDILTGLGAEIFTEMYPKNTNIKPLGNIRKSWYEKFIDEFIMSGSISKSDVSKDTQIVIEDFGRPVGIVSEKNNGYELVIDPLNDQLISLILESFADNKDCKVQDLYWKVRKSEFGVTSEVFDIFLSALIKKGLILGVGDGGEKLTLTAIKKPVSRNLKNIMHLCKGDLVDEKYIPKITLISESLFDTSLEGYDHPIQEQIWEDLKNFKESTLEVITENRNSLNSLIANLEYEELESKWKETFAKVSMMEKLVSEIPIEKSSKEGLETFVDKIDSYIAVDEEGNSTLAELTESFKKINTFIEDYSNILLSHFKSLTHKDLKIPESEKYRDLINLKKEILDFYLSGDKIIFESDLEDINNKFNAFLDMYRNIYQKEHLEVNKNPIFDEIWAIPDTPEYDLLSKLSAIELISVDNDFNNVLNDLKEEISKQCDSTTDISENRLICNCGFYLGTSKEIKSPEVIMSKIKLGLKEYIEKIQDHKEKIKDYSIKLKNTGNESTAKVLDDLLNINPNSQDLVKEVANCVNENVVHNINQALIVVESGKSDASLSPPIPKDLSDLVQILGNKTWTKKELLEKILNWLDPTGTIPDDAYIKCMSSAR